MPIEVEGPDGRVHPFADDTPDETIHSFMENIYGRKGQFLTPQTPQAGAPTAASGVTMPHMASTPGYMSSEDYKQLMLSQMFPHAAQLLQNTPGHQLRVAAAKKVGENLGNLEERQRAGRVVVDMLHQLGETADEGHKNKYLEGAIGPLDANEYWQRGRALALGWVPGLGKSIEGSYNLHNQLEHDIEGLTTAFIASAAKGGITMSDSRQKAFKDTMGAMMKATTKEEFDKIKKDAARIIEGTFGLAPGAYIAPRSSNRAPEQQHQQRPRKYATAPDGRPVVLELDGRQWSEVK